MSEKQAALAKGQVKVRVLVDCQHGRVNDVVPLDEKVAGQAQKDGLVDTEPAAVAYAESLAKEA
jgi:hypothetical protein